MSRPLRVVIDAQLEPEAAGGVAQFVASLVRSLGQLGDGDEEYVVVSSWEAPDWLQTQLGANQRLVTVPAPVSRSSLVPCSLRPLLVPFRWAHRIGTSTRSWMRAPLSRVPVSSGFLESQGELIHFPHQSFVSCAVPVIYNPHDLQHRHLPWFFTAREIARREAVYRTGCEAASAVVTESAWARQDLTTSYRTDPRRVCVIPRGSPISLTPGPSDQELTATRERYALPARFMLFPAQTWPHKNHLALLHSLALLQHEGLRVPVVCTGRATPHAATIKEEARRLNLKNQVVLLGFIPACDLRALYSLATLLIFPSLFEGGGFPIIEAFTEGLPVACAASTALPEYAGDAAVLFDPGSPTSMADAIRAVWQNDSLRARLRSAGLERARFLTWEVTARLYRALYRQVAGRQISAWEASILDLARVGGAFAIARAAHAGMAPDRDA